MCSNIKAWKSILQDKTLETFRVERCSWSDRAITKLSLHHRRRKDSHLQSWVLYSVSPAEIWLSLLLDPHNFRESWPDRISAGLPTPTTINLPSSKPTRMWLYSLVIETQWIGNRMANGVTLSFKLWSSLIDRSPCKLPVIMCSPIMHMSDICSLRTWDPRYFPFIENKCNRFLSYKELGNIKNLE